MTTIECNEEKYALNLNPNQVFIFINEKTKPYLEQFKEMQRKSKTYDIVLLPYEPSSAHQSVDDSVDPQLYNLITHSDVVARVMPMKLGDYRYMTETFFKGENYDFDYMNYKLEQFMAGLRSRKSQSYVNTIRRFFQYGNQEFCDFVMSIFNGNLKELIDMSNHFTHMTCTGDINVAQQFIRCFVNKLNGPQKDQLNIIIKDTLDYNSLKESEAIFTDFIHTEFDNDEPKLQDFEKKHVKNITPPNFNIVVKPTKKKKQADANGDYDILVVKDNGESFPLNFGYRGDKMFYMLTLLCQKAVGGLPTKFFSFNSSQLVIKQIYDEVFRSGGDVWVDTMSRDSHKISVSRTHAQDAIEKRSSMDLKSVYWCSLETKALHIGPKKKKISIRRVRIPDHRIIIDDNDLLTRYLRGLPSLEQIVGYVTPNAAKVMELNLHMPRGRFNYR